MCDKFVCVHERIASGLFTDALDKDASITKAHVLCRVGAFQIESEQIIFVRFDGFEKKVSLLDWIARLAEMIGAPLVATLLSFNFSFSVFLIDAIADGGAMNDGDDALVGAEQVPIN